MKKIWLPYPLYFLKPFVVGLIGIALLYVSENLFTSGFAVLCLGYSGWIIIMRVVWSVKNFVKSSLSSSEEKKDKTHFAKFPDD